MVHLTIRSVPLSCPARGAIIEAFFLKVLLVVNDQSEQLNEAKTIIPYLSPLSITSLWS